MAQNLSGKIALLEDANNISNFAIKQIEIDLENIYTTQESELEKLQNIIKKYFAYQFGIENRIQFQHEYLYIYVIDCDFSHLTLRLDMDKKLTINWFSTSCNSGNIALLNYLSILGVIANNIDKIETEFRGWIEEYEKINSLTKEKYKLLRNAKNQLSINSKEIEKLKKKIK